MTNKAELRLVQAQRDMDRATARSLALVLLCAAVVAGLLCWLGVAVFGR